jgi:hypothetical protein
MGDLSKTRIDITKSNEGVWFSEPVLFDDIEFLVGRQGSPRFAEFVQAEAQKPGGDKERDKKEERRHTDWVFANTILLGWKNLQIDGEDVPYSVEKAFELLQNDEYVEFRLFVLTKAQSLASFRKEALAEAAKN